MTAAEIATETEKIRAGIDKLTAAVRASGLTEGARVAIAALRSGCADAHARMLADQASTLKANLPPPRRGVRLRQITAHAAFLEACIILLDSILCQEVAA